LRSFSYANDRKESKDQISNGDVAWSKNEFKDPHSNGVKMSGLLGYSEYIKEWALKISTRCIVWVVTYQYYDRPAFFGIYDHRDKGAKAVIQHLFQEYDAKKESMGMTTLEGHLYLRVPAYTVTGVDHLNSKEPIYLYYQEVTDSNNNDNPKRPTFDYHCLSNNKRSIYKSMTDTELEQRFGVKINTPYVGSS
jgi:hypothetical protein